MKAAFFDVDDTLVGIKTLFRFWEFHVGAAGPERAEYERTRKLMRALPSRADALALYCTLLAGHEVESVAAAGRRWFAEERARGPVFHDAVENRLRAHAAAGDTVVLVSGSFPACLEPIADHVGADVLLCSRPEVLDGCYTGALATPMVGDAKVTAVRAEAAARGLDLAASAAYGDHASDLALLRLTGSPVVVGEDPVLTAAAARHGWPRLPIGEAYSAVGRRMTLR
jgi:HAD superfamily hydrolase (TIGR01490 family)